jgi:Transposase, Mutator family
MVHDFPSSVVNAESSILLPYFGRRLRVNIQRRLDSQYGGTLAAGGGVGGGHRDTPALQSRSRMNTKPASASWSVKCLAQIPARPDLWVSSPISTVTLGSRGQHRRAVRGLGMAIGHSEAEPFMGVHPAQPRRARPAGVVASESHDGLNAATSRIFSSTWQRCRVHFHTASRRKVSRASTSTTWPDSTS